MVVREQSAHGLGHLPKSKLLVLWSLFVVTEEIFFACRQSIGGKLENPIFRIHRHVVYQV
jgi:hypothetical protein